MASDHTDQLRITYGVDKTLKKWWQQIIGDLLDIVSVKSFIIDKQIYGIISLLEFQRLVVQGLITAYIK